ncbi:hypothetical protein GCM10023196_089510 [Actinoallomurus vinaceus]|uniref:Uncharacterized protein n=1 Tax=Actinoallomurus vinaceus TaxID=1080074 RepID=A0ABP8UPP6_9ACTN
MVTSEGEEAGAADAEGETPRPVTVMAAAAAPANRSFFIGNSYLLASTAWLRAQLVDMRAQAG